MIQVLSGVVRVRQFGEWFGEFCLNPPGQQIPTTPEQITR
jgi:hypothetical protein